MNTSGINMPTTGTLSHMGWRATGLILIGCAVMFLILQVGTIWLAGMLDQTWAAFIVTAIMLPVAVVWERLVFNLTLPQALHALGFGRLNARPLLAAGAIACIMLMFFPVFSFTVDAPVSLKRDWLWMLMGIIALNGFAEETLFRGFVFGGLREAGLSFGRAGTISMVIFATVHVLLFVQNPFIIALLGTLVAMAAAFPMAYLFERGSNTLWAPVMLHVAAHAIRLVDIPERYYLPAVSIWLVLQVGGLFLVFAFRGSLLKPTR